MPGGTLVLLILVVMMFSLVLLRKPQSMGEALGTSFNQIVVFGLRLPLALLSAAFVSLILPPTLVAPYIGPETGWLGILIASVFGAFVPGGPMMAFPVALVIWRAGAGEAQMIAFLAAWTVFAVHRMLSYEIPMLGPRFILIRVASSWMLPFIAGGLGLLILAVAGMITGS